jgi:hypothetical protein
MIIKINKKELGNIYCTLNGARLASKGECCKGGGIKYATTPGPLGEAEVEAQKAAEGLFPEAA